ncbi:Protein tpx2 [Physocladia obscura]|uniref:Protein tpx2 n=1 Tax=Physocladia obscura TaxID=109957 RepID=A0AAD5X8M6_9FUNG|nr:Protein tpx2 [Physocladia obscura]
MQTQTPTHIQTQTHAYSSLKPSKLSASIIAPSSSPPPQTPPESAQSEIAAPISSRLRPRTSRTPLRPAPATETTPKSKATSKQQQQSKDTNADSAFEFNASKFCDFARVVTQQQQLSSLNGVPVAPSAEKGKPIDAWFSDHRSSPLVEGFRVANPTAMLDQLEIEEDLQVTPKASKISPVTATSSTPKSYAAAVLENLRSSVDQPPSPAAVANASKATSASRRPSTTTLSSVAKVAASVPPQRPQTATTIKATAATATTTSGDIGRMFAQLSLSATSAAVQQVIRRSAPHDLEAQERLLGATVAWKAKHAGQYCEFGNSGSGGVGKKHGGATVPKEFSFMSRAGSTIKIKSPVIKFVDIYNSNPSKKRKPIIKRFQNDLTVPRPFKFHEKMPHNNKYNNAEDGPRSPFVPLVNRMKHFEIGTPERFKTTARNSKVKIGTIYVAPRLTKPYSPFLMTKQRSKPTNLKTTEEMQIEEIANHPRFKARPLDKKILKEGNFGVPIVEKPVLTVPKSPHFSRPRTAPSTYRQPPPRQQNIIKANPIRYASTKPFEPHLEHRQIVPDDVRLPGEQMRCKKLREFEEALKAKQKEDEKKRIFMARPIPDLSAPAPLPEVKPRPPTEPEPFNLHVHNFPVVRSAFQTKPDGSIEISSAELVPTAQIKFTAQPMPIFEPFVPKKSNKLPTVPDSVVLHTDSRAEERRVFEEAKRAREAVEEEMRELAKLEREEFERHEIRRIRQDQTFQAQPIRQFPGVQVHASQKRLTEPSSPMLKEKRERLARMRSSLSNESSSRPGNNQGNYSSETVKIHQQRQQQLPRSCGGSGGKDEEEGWVSGVPYGEFENGCEEQNGGFEVKQVQVDEIVGSNGFGGVLKKHWPRPVDWIDSDGLNRPGSSEF